MVVREETTVLVLRPAFELQVTPKDASLFVHFKFFFYDLQKERKANHEFAGYGRFGRNYDSQQTIF